MSVEEKRIFRDISYAIGDGKPHSLEDIKGAGIRKEDKEKYMSLFVEMGYYILEGDKYTIIQTGKDKFKKIKDPSERVAEGRLVYWK